MSQNEDILYLEVQPISCRAASEEDREHEDSSPESEKEREEEGDVPSQNAMDEEDAAAALATFSTREHMMLCNMLHESASPQTAQWMYSVIAEFLAR